MLNTDNIPPAIREIKLKSPKNCTKLVYISTNGPNPATAKALLPFLDLRTFSEGDLRIIARPNRKNPASPVAIDAVGEYILPRKFELAMTEGEMKWHRIVFLSLFSAIFSLLILGIVRVWGIWRLSLYFSLIPAGLFVIFAFSLRKMNLEQHFALLKKLYDFLENDNIPSPANLQDYPREYSKSFDAASDELVDAGLILVGDFEAPEEELGCGKKAFQRTLRSSDGSIWANVKRIRSDSLYGFFIRLLWGRRALQPIVEISMFQENDVAVAILNCRQLTAASFSGLRFIFLPDKSPVELLSWAKQYKSGVEMETDTSFRHIDHKKFASLSISHGIRMSYQITSRANPKWEGMTTEQLTEAGFSQRGIEKYRKICTMSFPEDVRSRPQQ